MILMAMQLLFLFGAPGGTPSIPMIGNVDVSAKSLIAATMDAAGIASLIAALAAVIAMILSNQSNKRTAVNTESVSYVDNNLKTMQATLDWLQKDNDRLRVVNEEQRKQNIAFARELEAVEHELEHVKENFDKAQEELHSCTKRCSVMEMTLKKLGVQND